MASLFRRRSVRFALAIVVVCVVLVLVVRSLVPADKVRDLIIAQIKANSGVDVTFGEAKVAFWPRLKVVVAKGAFEGTGRDLALAGQPTDQERSQSASDNIESFRGRVDRLEVDLALRPLLKKRIEIGSVRLVGPHLELVTLPESAVGEEGSARITGRRPESTAQAAGAVEFTAWELAVAGVEIRDGSVLWRESGTGREVELSGWNQDVTAVDLQLLLERLTSFQYGLPPPTETTSSELAVTTRLKSLTLRGFGDSPPILLEELRLSGVLSAPSTVDRVVIRVEELTWRRLSFTAELELMQPVRGVSHLNGSWSLLRVSLPDLVADLTSVASASLGDLEAWSATESVKGGSLDLGGKLLQLPWPLPSDVTPEVVSSHLAVTGKLTEVRLHPPDLPSEVVLGATIGLAQGELRVENFHLQDVDGNMKITGNLTAPLPGAAGALRASLQGEGDLTALNGWLPAPPADEADPRIAGRVRLAGRFQCRAEVDIPAPPPLADAVAWQDLVAAGHLRGVAITGGLTDLAVAGAMPGEPWRVRRVTFASDLRTATFSCEDVVHPTVRGAVTGRATKLLPVPELELNFEVARLDLDELVAQFQSPTETALRLPSTSLATLLIEEWVGAVVAAAPAEAGRTPPGELIPAELMVSYRGHAKEVILQKARYDEVRLAGELAQRVFDFTSVTAQRGGGHISGNGQIDYMSDPYGRLTFAAQAKDVPAAVLLAPYAPKVAPLWEGKVSTTVSGSCRLQDKSAVLSSLSLAGDAGSTNGQIDARSLLADISSYLSQRQDLKVIRYKEFLHHLEVAEGRYHIRDLRLNGLDTDWWGEGWLGFDGGIDMQLTVKLPVNFQPDLGDLNFLANGLRGKDGRIKLDLQLTGRAAKPTVHLNLTQAKEQAQQNIQESMKQGLQGLLDKLKRK